MVIHFFEFVREVFFMRLTEKTAEYAILKTAYHGGGIIGFSNSLTSALKTAKKHTNSHCSCGCCGVVPITPEARTTMRNYVDDYGNKPYANNILPLLSAYPDYQPELKYFELCR